MKVIITSNNHNLMVELESNELVENLKAILEVETNIPLLQQELWFEGKQLLNSMTLDAAKVSQNSRLTLVSNNDMSAGGHVTSNLQSNGGNGSTMNSIKFRSPSQENSSTMAELQQAHGRPNKRQHREGNEPKFNNNCSTSGPISTSQHDIFITDPFDIDVQKRIEEDIRQKNVDDNWEAAIEHNPEAFARVVMLYVDMEVNGYPIKAFVDSGAQSTIISMYCAERCGLLRLLDRRYNGIAKGVGESMIVGRIHVAPLKIGKNYYPCSFTVLDHADIEFIFGLDMLRKHQCTIDLKENVMWIGGRELAVPFLQEKDLPPSLLLEPRIT